jgi:hypothetical protein
VYRRWQKQAKAYQGQAYTKPIFESRKRSKVVKNGKKVEIHRLIRPDRAFLCVHASLGQLPVLQQIMF